MDYVQYAEEKIKGGRLFMEQRAYLLDYLEYRCSVYYSLKTIFLKEATMAQIRQLIRGCKKVVELDDMPKAEQAYIEYFSSITEEQIKTLREEMKPEYARLFLGPQKRVAPPYESVYRSKNQCIYGVETSHVKQFYKNAGMELTKKMKMPDDFIGTELEFMYWMSHRMYQAVKENQDELAYKMAVYQHEFLVKHLLEWVPEFTKRIKEGSTMEYFNVSAAYLEEFIKEDAMFMESLR